MQSLKRVESHWLPELRRIGVRVPILLIASKTDLMHQDIDELFAVRLSRSDRTHSIDISLEASMGCLR